MTRLKGIVLGSLAAALVVCSVGKSFAEESGTFKNRLNGATIGIPAGAAAPAGIYSGLETAYLGWPGSGTGNQAPGLFLPAIAQAVPIVWSTGWNILGASYSVVVVQAFYSGTVLTGSPFNFPTSALVGGYNVDANTFWSPINLSWNLGNGWFVSGSFNFVAPDGGHYPGTPNPDYWTFEPAVAISYINANWVASVNMFYDINTSSGGVCCVGVPGFRSGDMFYADMFAAYKWGKWSFGPVAFVEQQTTNDTIGGVNCVGVLAICGIAHNFAVGGIVGYDFGPVDLQVWVTQSVSRNNEIDGLDVWTRIGFKIWGPDAPKPLVAKN